MAGRYPPKRAHEADRPSAGFGTGLRRGARSELPPCGTRGGRRISAPSCGASAVLMEALVLPGRIVLRGAEGRRDADAVRAAVGKFGLEATVETISPCG